MKTTKTGNVFSYEEPGPKLFFCKSVLALIFANFEGEKRDKRQVKSVGEIYTIYTTYIYESEKEREREREGEREREK